MLAPREVCGMHLRDSARGLGSPGCGVGVTAAILDEPKQRAQTRKQAEVADPLGLRRARSWEKLQSARGPIAGPPAMLGSWGSPPGLPLPPP